MGALLGAPLKFAIQAGRRLRADCDCTYRHFTEVFVVGSIPLKMLA